MSLYVKNLSRDVPYSELRRTSLSQDVALGSQILSSALAFDELISIGASQKDAIKAMGTHRGQFAPRLLGLLSEVKLPGQDLVVMAVPTRALRIGMTIDQDVRATDGNLIVAKGNEISASMLERLRNYAEAGTITDRIRVRDSVDQDEIAA